MTTVIRTLTAFFTLSAVVAAAPEIKSTTRLVIFTDRVGNIEITSADVLAMSNVYAGEFIGVPAQAPDASLTRYTIAFDVQTVSGVKQDAYVVQYVFDDSTGEAFIYLPARGEPNYRRNVSTILRDGQDGSWHRASDAWAQLIRNYVR